MGFGADSSQGFENVGVPGGILPGLEFLPIEQIRANLAACGIVTDREFQVYTRPDLDPGLFNVLRRRFRQCQADRAVRRFIAGEITESQLLAAALPSFAEERSDPGVDPLAALNAAIERLTAELSAPSPPPPPPAPIEVPVGFLDSVGSFFGGAIDAIGGAIGGIASGAVNIGGQVIQAGLANPAAVIQSVQLLQQLRQGSPSTAQLMQLQGLQGGTMAINPNTGAPFAPGFNISTTTGDPISQFVAQLPAVLGRVLGSTGGSVAAGAAGAVGVDALLGLLGGPQTLMELGPPPVNPVTGRRKSSITFVDPNSGRPVVYKSQGAVVLTSGDLSSTRRVQRVARRAARGRRRSPARQALLPARSHVVCGQCLTSPCGCKG